MARRRSEECEEEVTVTITKEVVIEGIRQWGELIAKAKSLGIPDTATLECAYSTATFSWEEEK